MKNSFEYRSYVVSNESGRYVARPEEGDDFCIASVYLLRVLRSIDALWAALDQIGTAAAVTMPMWIRDWLAKPVDFIDLDLANGAEPPSAPVQIISFPTHKVAFIGKSAATA
ncbi:hypothetical protein QA641_34940 [Bradyrhizobium sp. CB1650]|uniref:hypothetical protein n=1 Tax=Bradyrhizobium sp. CB1650 TaxID=3039153 RepID=UPI002435D305|nr:hypothetical protein [Bradyrhizobium sp. CB1650]WGD50743.1 hypothetical protein QA641_34940 [Bradyrhizobium sp. CB1650]